MVILSIGPTILIIITQMKYRQSKCLEDKQLQGGAPYLAKLVYNSNI